MQAQVAERLGEIASIEQELGSVVDASVRRVQDPDIKDRMRETAERHRHHAGQLLGMEGVSSQRGQQAERIAEEVAAIRRRVEHAVGQDGLMAALGHLEQEEEVRLGEALAADVDPELADLLRALQGDISDDVRIFLDESAGMAPGVGDPRNTV